MPDILSRHNILTPLHNKTDWLLVNLLHQQADVIEAELAHRIRSGEVLDAGSGDPDYRELAEKGYIIDEASEQSAYRLAYSDFISARDESEVQVFYVPGYACNFACDYCYQDGYTHAAHPHQDEVIDAFFAHTDEALAGRKWYLTIFGGEPLLPGDNQRKIIRRLIEGCNAREVSIAVVTNGYHLDSYIELLRTARVKEIQITLDGVGQVHDARRPLKTAVYGGGSASSFEGVVRGIDAGLDAGFMVNLRTVIDRDNISGLVDLADFAIQKGWTGRANFKTQLGRNYELHYCQEEQTRLYTRLEMYADLYDEISRHPQILEFHAPAFSISRFLFENGELPVPLFDSCPGTKSEWAYDSSGRIYACTATVGKDGEELGTFWPEVSLDRDAVEEWEERDVLSIEKCRGCSLQLACGGGCAAVAINRQGKVHAPDCRPVDGLMSLGVSLYSDMEIPKKALESITE
jgi:uncharacterized protein